MLSKEQKAKYGAVENEEGVSIGSQFAEIMHYYPGYTFNNIYSLTDYQLEYLLYHIPYLEGKRQGQIAKLEATLLNAMGGKSDSGKSMPPHKAFHMHERLVYYADLGQKVSLSPRAARAIKENTSKMPSWTIDLVDWNQIKAS
jgi:hypothetical protein